MSSLSQLLLLKLCRGVKKCDTGGGGGGRKLNYLKYLWVMTLGCELLVAWKKTLGKQIIIEPKTDKEQMQVEFWASVTDGGPTSI